MHNEKIEIVIEDYDEDHIIAYVEKNNKSMLFIFALYDCAENMEFWGFNVTYGSKNARDGLIFEGKDKTLAKTEIEIFINQYNLNECDP